MISLQGRRVLVTGATGFIGNRLIERLILEQEAEVVALVHQFRRASRLGRFPVRMVNGDVTDAATVKKAGEGCDAIVHCAVTFAGSPQANRQVTVEGTRNVCEVARTLGVRRVVHFSTVSVYGNTAPGPLNESAPKAPGADAYGSSKLEAEQLVQQCQRQGLPAIILQPTIVYGPWSFWSTYAAKQLRAGEVALPDDGAGLCNAVYVDDVVGAVFLSLSRETVTPGPFLISAAAPVTWRDYFLAHVGALSNASVVGLTGDELTAIKKKEAGSWSPRDFVTPGMWQHIKGIGREIPLARRAVSEVPWVRKAYFQLRNRIQPAVTGSKAKKQERPRILPEAEHLELLRSRSAVEIQRARDELGYQPAFDLARGGAIVEQWLRWTRLTV